MNKYIIYNIKTLKTECFKELADAERSVINSGENHEDYFLGKLTHEFKKVSNHLEATLIDQASFLSSYVPQEGDTFVKYKNPNKINGASSAFKRKLIKVNVDSVVIQNRNRTDERYLQVMPLYQWKAWIRGATFIPKEEL